MMVGAATVFVVTDIAKSTEHCRDALGFTVTFEYGTPTFYVCLCRDEVALHLLLAGQTSRLSGNGSCLKSGSSRAWPQPSHDHVVRRSAAAWQAVSLDRGFCKS
jgi:hypothetical protein